MEHAKSGQLPVLAPNLQISFYYRLQAIRTVYLHEAFQETVKGLDIREIDSELASYVSKQALNKVASSGLRGEVFFAVPCIVHKNPHLLGYYRLLLGFSQKEFYAKGPFGRFKKLEEDGEITSATRPAIPALCKSVIASAEMLVEGIDQLSLDLVRSLQLLTVGAQLRGSENTRLGQRAIEQVYGLILEAVRSYATDATRRTIIVRNKSKRNVLIEFASDPDVRISEKLASGLRPLVSIEVKGGADVSNVHNRLGEAEKSHQKAKGRGFFEFWTIVRADVDLADVARESPTTSHFFNLDAIGKPGSADNRRFREMLCSTVGIPD